MAPRRATVYTVAEHAGVSVATVSRVLAAPERVAEATKARVLESVSALNFVPHGAAQSLAAHRHAAHGLVLPELDGPYYSDLLIGYESVVAEHNESLIVALAGERRDLDSALRRLAANVDGVVIMGASRIPTDTLDAIRARVPVLGLADGGAAGIETWRTANRESARALALHLAEHGRTAPVFVGDPDLAVDIAERYEGFASVFPDAPPPIRTMLRERDGGDVATQLLSGVFHADALMCANDELALAISTTLHDAGTPVGDTISIVGWDDVMAARYIRPSLTTVRQPVVELGARVAERMRDVIEHGGSADAVGLDSRTLPTEVVIRDSCGSHPTPQTSPDTSYDT